MDKKSKTRIDKLYLFYIFCHIDYYKTEYVINSDHLGIKVKINLSNDVTRGFWKLNTENLKSRQMITEIRKEIQS